MDDHYRCSDGQCIPNRFLCDGFPDDCPNNEDENESNCDDEEGGLIPLHSVNMIFIPFLFIFYRTGVHWPRI